MTAKEAVEALGLKPLPWEGGWFRRIWQSPHEISADALPDVYQSPKLCGSAIYYLIDRQNFSAMHRVRTDELFHHYIGASVEMLLIEPGAEGRWLRLGKAIANGEAPMACAPAMAWQGARIAEDAEQDWALLGATLAPAYDDEDFELGSRDALCAAHPHLKQAITALTRS